MKILHRNLFAFGVALCTLLVNPVLATNLSLYSSKDCLSLGGSWMPPLASGRLRSCALPSGFTVATGDRLEIGPNVDLIVSNGRSLIVEGTLFLLQSAAVYVNSNGYLRVTGLVELNDQSLLALNNGSLGNYGVIRSQGKITNAASNGTTMPDAIFNAGLIQIFSGGILENRGLYADVTPANSTNTQSLIVDLRGEFRNMAGARAHMRFAFVHGLFWNESGAKIKLRHVLEIKNGGTLENSGQIIMWSEPARLTIHEGGTLESMSHSYITNEGGSIAIQGTLRLKSGTLLNLGAQSRYGDSTINIQSSGMLKIEGRSFVSNDTDATINNMGNILIECFAAFENNGTLNGKDISRTLCYPDPGFKNPPAIPWNF